MKQKIEFTPEEKAEIRKARWDGAKTGLKASPFMGAIVGSVNGLGEFVDSAQRADARRQAIRDYDAHISDFKSMFKPGNPAVQHPVSQDNARNHHNDISRLEMYKRQRRKEIEGIKKETKPRMAKSFAGSMVGTAGIYSLLHSHFSARRKKKEILDRRKGQQMNKTAAARRPSVGTRIRMSLAKPEYASENLYARKDYNDIHFNVKNNYRNHMLHQEPSRDSQRSEIIHPGLYEKSKTYSSSKEKASITRKDPDYYSDKYIKDSAEKAKSDRADKNRHIMSAINQSGVARSRNGYYRLPETNNSNGLSTGAKLGIGAGGAVIGALALRRYLKKRRQAKEQGENK